MILLLFVAMSCVDKANIAIAITDLPLVIEGYVTNELGKSLVRISQAFPIDGQWNQTKFVSGAQVTIKDNLGNETTLVETSPGTYTAPSLEGVMGRSYQLAVSKDNQHFESTQETMRDGGSIDNLYFEYTETTEGDGDLPLRGFNIYIDSHSASGSSNRMRWKATGTFEATGVKGFVGVTTPCWVFVKEKAPILSSETFATGNFNRVFVAFVPANAITFFGNKYRIDVEQTELSSIVFDFYKGIRGQSENGTSLSQPPYFELKGNIKTVGGGASVIGIFSANSVARKAVYIRREDSPAAFPTVSATPDCSYLSPFYTFTKPPFWE